MADDDEKWSRDGSKDEEASPDIEVLVEAEVLLVDSNLIVLHWNQLQLL